MDDEPEIAHQIARFIALFACIEVNFPAILSTLTGVDRSTAEHLLSITTSFSRRMEMINVAHLAAKLPPDAELFFDEVLSEAKSIERRRNIYAHSVYQSTDKKGEIRLLSYRLDFRQTVEEVITAETVKRDCIIAERLTVALWKQYEGTSHERLPLRGKRQ